MLKFYKAVNGRFGEITLLMKKMTTKKHIFDTKAKNKDKWMGIVSYIEMIWYD